MVRLKGDYTKEDYEIIKTIVLDGFKKGLPMRRMQSNLGITQYSIKQIREQLISEGSITREEIDSAYQQYMIENPPAQGLDKRKVRQKSNTEKAEKRHGKSLERKEKTLELVLAKKSIAEIAKELQMSETAISWYIRALKQEGRLDGVEIVKARSGKTVESRIDRTSQEYINNRDDILKLLKMGWRNGAIRKKLDITPYNMAIYLSDVKTQGLITSAEIEEAREKKKKSDIDELASYVKSGLTMKDFRKAHPEFSYNEVTPLIKELIEQGIITREQVNNNIHKATVKSLNKNVQMSPKEQFDFILDKVKQGYTPTEILESDKTNSLTLHKIYYQKRLIISQGIISAEEAERLMNERQQRKLDEKHNELISRIIDYTKQGYNFSEIANILGCGVVFVSQLKTEYAQKNGWFSKEEIKEFIRQRRIREFEALPQEEKDRILKEQKEKLEQIEKQKLQRQEDSLKRRQEKKDKRELEHKELLESIKEYTLKGKTVSQIAELLGLNIRFVYSLQYEAQRNGTWLSEKEIKTANQKKEKQRIKQVQKRREKKAKQIESEKMQRALEEEQRKLQELRTVRDLTASGLSNNEIAKQMHYSIAKISALKREAIQKGIWFSDEEKEEYKKERIKREQELELARQKAKQEQAEKERKERERALKKEQEAIEAAKKEKRKKLKPYIEQYKTKKRNALRENNQEFSGKEAVSADNRKQFADLVVKLHDIGVDVVQQDVDLIFDTICMHHEIVEPKYLKFLIAYSNEQGGLDAAKRMTIELENVLDGTKFKKPLYEYEKWIQGRKNIITIKQLREQGLNNESIAKRLRLTTAEVVVLMNSDGIDVEFFDR